MTREQRIQVWQQKDQLTARLQHMTDTNAQKQSKEQIDACNQSLVSDVFILPVEASEPLEIQCQQSDILGY